MGGTKIFGGLSPLIRSPVGGVVLPQNETKFWFWGVNISTLIARSQANVTSDVTKIAQNRPYRGDFDENRLTVAENS